MVIFIVFVFVFFYYKYQSRRIHPFSLNILFTNDVPV